MLFRNSTATQDEPKVTRSTYETIVRRSSGGRIYTIELPADANRPEGIYGARVAQMAAMNRTVGVCRGVSREDVLRKAAALIDAALPGALPKAA